MMKKYTFSHYSIVIFFLFFYCTGVFAQKQPDFLKIKSTNNINDYLERLLLSCDSVYLAGDNKLLEKNLTIAFKITPKNDAKHLSRFWFYKGLLTESSTASSDSCIKNYEQALKYARQVTDTKIITQSLGSILSLCNPEKKSGKTRRDSIAKVLQTVVDSKKDKYAVAVALLFISRYYKLTGNDGKALQYALNAFSNYKELYESKKISSDEVAEAAVIVSRTYGNMAQEAKQQVYLEEMRKYLVKNKVLLSYYYLYTAKNLVITKKMSEAELYYDSLLNICKKYSNAELWNNCLDADMYFAQGFIKFGKNKEALKYSTHANTIGEIWAFDFYKAQLNYVNGKVYLALKDYTKALPYFKKAEPLALAWSYQDMRIFSIENIANCYAGLGNWAQAYAYSKKLSMLKDSLTAIDTKKIFAEAEEKYQNKEKKQLINIQNEQLVFAKKQKWWLISGLLLSGFVVVLLYAIYRNKKQSANILDQKNRELDILNKKLNESNLTKTKLFGIISHDLRSPVSQLFTFLKLQQKNDMLVSEEERDQHRQKLITSSKNLLETMEDLLLWSKSQMENFELDIDEVDLAQLFSDTVLLMQNQADAKEIRLITEIKGIGSLNSDQNLLLIILRNLVQNAINHAFNRTTIYLRAGLNQNSQIYIAVINQGEVIPADQIQALIDNKQVKSKSSGYGLLIVKELALKINAVFNISSGIENGTEITLVF